MNDAPAEHPAVGLGREDIDAMRFGTLTARRGVAVASKVPSFIDWDRNKALV